MRVRVYTYISYIHIYTFIIIHFIKYMIIHSFIIHKKEIHRNIIIERKREYAMKKTKKFCSAPKTVLIDSVRYNINYTEYPVIVDGQQCLGAIDYNNGNIEIDISKTGANVLPKVLMHEIVHGLLQERNVQDFLGDNTENIVDNLAIGFVNLVRLNPKLIDYLTNVDKID